MDCLLCPVPQTCHYLRRLRQAKGAHHPAQVKNGRESCHGADHTRSIRDWGHCSRDCNLHRIPIHPSQGRCDVVAGSQCPAPCFAAICPILLSASMPTTQPDAFHTWSNFAPDWPELRCLVAWLYNLTPCTLIPDPYTLYPHSYTLRCLVCAPGYAAWSCPYH